MILVSVQVFAVRSQVGGSKESRRHKPAHVCDMKLVFREDATGKDVHDRLKDMLGDGFAFSFKL